VLSSKAMVISLSISILFLNKSAEAAELEEMYVCKFKICFSMMSSLFFIVQIIIALGSWSRKPLERKNA